MKTCKSILQWEQRTVARCEGAMASSRSQLRHLKSMIGVMKPLILIVLFVTSVQAQSLADAARKEKERQSKLTPVYVITADNSKVEPVTPKAEEGKTTDSKPAAATPSKELPKPQAAPPTDPVKAWNERVAQLRAKIRTLQDQGMALLLQQNEQTNQVYAVITDPATQERAQAQLAQTQQQIAVLQAELEESKRTLDAMLLEGPPKK